MAEKRNNKLSDVPSQEADGDIAAHEVDDSPLSIVGIGASAGGLAALKTLFTHIPENPGVGFVVVVHLSPDHESHLADLLQPYVRMPVQQVTKTTLLEKNHVYVIPPNANLNSIDTHLRLSKLEDSRQERAPIDHFFRTLSKTRDGRAIGVILTGTGSDGTLGLKEIKGRNGFVVIQDPKEAEFDGMPQSALAAGIVDAVLPLHEIGPAVLGYARTRTNVEMPAEDAEAGLEQRRFLQEIFTHIRARTGRDFTRYKQSTILRRIRRRMQLHRIEQLDEYVKVLRQAPEEVQSLADDMLITVTNFFRDPETFEHLSKQVFPGITAGKSPIDEVRVWSVGCATGEEAYSIAMLLVESFEEGEPHPRIQVFASDLHEHSLRRARDGFFPGDIEADVSAERLRRFFTKENGGYRIRKELREKVVFAPHNLMGDPPFSRLDLILCRNVLIYLQREVQHDVAELFHYALRPDGYLVTGTSETIAAPELFRVMDKKHCLYQKRNVRGPEPRLPVFPRPLPHHQGIITDGPIPKEPLSFGRMHQETLERYAPPSILVGPDFRVVHLSDHAGKYLVHPGGESTSSLFKLIREELRFELRRALHTALDTKKAISTSPIRVQLDGHEAAVVLHIWPTLESKQEGFVLILFDERTTPDAEVNELVLPLTSERAVDVSHVRSLESELEVARQRLQAMIEEYDTGQEEMRASNEELQSANEELRSTLEELETSKEELQSMNEELHALNQENRHKVEELGQLSDDLQNLLEATKIATLFLDRELRIMRFTPPIADLFNVRLSDRGRPISDLTHRLGYSDLSDDARQVLEKLIPIEREVQDAAGKSYLARLLPYRSTDDRIQGVVISLFDITARKEAEVEVQKAKDYAETIIDTLPEPLLVLNSDLAIESANTAFYKSFGCDAKATLGRRIYSLGAGEWDVPDLRKLLEIILPEQGMCHGYLTEYHFERLGRRVIQMNARRVESMGVVLLAITDVTEHVLAERAVRELNESLEEEVSRRTTTLRLLQDITRAANEARTVE
jgi:two-component system CheB/CheR fusion protein